MWMRPRIRDVLGILGIYLVCLLVLRIAPDDLVIYALVLVFCGLVTAVIAQRKGWSGEGLFGWFLLGLALPLVGLMVVAFRRPLSSQADRSEEKRRRDGW
jgi:membrane protease YdiL (CAAX protease family)